MRVMDSLPGVLGSGGRNCTQAQNFLSHCRVGVKLSEAHRCQGRTPGKEVESEGADSKGRSTDGDALRLSKRRDDKGPNQAGGCRNWGGDQLERRPELETTALGI